MFEKNSCEKNQNETFFEKSGFMRECGKVHTVGQTVQDYIIRRMCFACWIPKATNTHSEQEKLNAFYGNNNFANAPQCLCLFICTLLVILSN
jgi:hypothetical protein